MSSLLRVDSAKSYPADICVAKNIFQIDTFEANLSQYRNNNQEFI